MVYAPPCIPGVDVGEKRGIYTFSFVVLNVFGKFFVNSTDRHITMYFQFGLCNFVWYPWMNTCTVSFMMILKVISTEVGWDGSPA